MSERTHNFTAKDGQPFEVLGPCRVTVRDIPGKGRRFDVTIEPLPVFRRREDVDNRANVGDTPE